MIRSNILYLTVLLNQPARWHNRCWQNTCQPFSLESQYLETYKQLSCNRNEAIQSVSTWWILKRGVFGKWITGPSCLQTRLEWQLLALILNQCVCRFAKGLSKAFFNLAIYSLMLSCSGCQSMHECQIFDVTLEWWANNLSNCNIAPHSWENGFR